MKIKKRELKTQLITLSLVLTTFLSSFSVVRAAYAFSPQYFSFTHGSVSIGTYIEEANTTTATSFDIATVCSAVFDKYYTGTVTLKWTYNSSNYQQNITLWSIVVVGGKIDSMTSGTLVIRVYDQDSFQVIMHYYAGNLASIPSDDPGFNFTGATSSLTAVTNHNDEYDNIKSIDTRIQGLNTNLVDLIGKAQTCSGYLSDISTFVDGVEGYLAKEYNGTYDSDVEQLLNTIKTDQQTANTKLTGISSSITSLHSYLGTVIGAWSIQDPPMTIIEALNSIAGDMASVDIELSNIYTQIQTINNNVSNINSLLTTMQQDLSSLLSTVQNIDNIIDTISWIPDELDIQISGDGSNWVNSGYVTAYRNSGNCAYIRVNTWINGTENLYKFTLNFGSINIGSTGNYIAEIGYLNSNNEIVMLTENNDNSISYSGTVYRWGIMQNLYLANFYTFSVDYPLIIKIQWLDNSSGNKRLYMPTSVSHISQSDIEYWQLISYFQQVNQYSVVNDFDASLYSKLNDIIDAINNIQVTVNVTEQEITNITNNFDFDIDIIHNVENNYKIDFDGWNNQLPASDLAVDLTPYNSTLNFIKANITTLWTNPFVNLPIIVSCLCFVFMVILG